MPPPPEKIWFYPIDHATNAATDTLPWATVQLCHRGFHRKEVLAAREEIGRIPGSTL
jgi:hypothetical protein